MSDWLARLRRDPEDKNMLRVYAWRLYTWLLLVTTAGFGGFLVGFLIGQLWGRL